MNILIYGLQRSGTNFLSEILKTDKKINIINGLDRNIFTHKHYRFHNIKEIIADEKFYPTSNIKTVADIYDKSPVNKIIVLEKDIYQWYDSIVNWAKKCNWNFIEKDFIEEFVKDHFHFYSFFKNEKDIIYLKYEDLLYNKEMVISKLEENDIHVSGEFTFNGVPMSEGDTKKFKEKYRNYKSSHEEDIKKALNKLI